jgi:tetratricopeptide (TPR) repeat protein
MLAVAPPRAELEARARQGMAELDAWDLEAARRIADELMAVAPEEGVSKELMAHVRFEEGEYARAVELFDSTGLRDQELAGLARATFQETRSYETRESPHFILRSRPGKDALLAPYAFDALERERAGLEKDLRFAPARKIRVEVLDDARALSRTSTLSLEAIKTSGTIAVCKFDKLMIISPKALVRGYPWLDTLAHEYVHLVVSQMSRNQVPIWIQEGLAKFYESRWRGAPGLDLSPPAAALLAEALKRKKLIPFDRMHPSMALLPSQEDAALAFAEVFTAIEYLHGKGGDDLIVRLIEELKKTGAYRVALNKATGIAFPQFQNDWMAFLARREYPKETLPLSVEKLEFKEDSAKSRLAGKEKRKPDELNLGDFQEIDDPEGRKLAHLGELLRQRNRYRAAADELARAYARVGNRSVLLSNRYAQTLVKLGERAKAEQILGASLKPFPKVARTYQALAEIYLESKRWDQAERAFLEVVSIDPFDPLPHLGLLKIYTDRGDAPKASREKAALSALQGQELRSTNEGLLRIQSHPYARVFLNGVDTGKTTPAQLAVPAGSHTLKLVNDERGFTREAAVEIEAGEEKTVEVVLEGRPE